MISLSAAVRIIFTIIVAGLIFWLLWWLVGYLTLPQPFDKVARVVLVVLAVAVLIGLLFQSVTGKQIFRE